MDNISELIGIIKGINFDGIINEEEIEYLQIAVNRNRNLAYEKEQIEFINFLDSILENHIIDNDKKLFVANIEKYLKGMKYNKEKIYELNGIVKGIICDGEVNRSEIFHLKEWVDNYGSLIRNYKSGTELCEIIDNILKNGVVIENGQQQFNELSIQNKKNQIEMKINYLCKQVVDKKNIGIDLINILNDETVIVEIHKKAESQLIKALSSYNNYFTDYPIIVISLSLIAMLKYNGNYYGNVNSTYTEVYCRYTKQKIEDFIRTLLSKYKKENYSNNRSRIINVVLENAIVPQEFLPAFFDFIFDIYKMNFEYDLPEEPYEDFQFVFEGLRNKMLLDSDDISINITQKTYKLIVATKQLITRKNGLDTLIKLSIIIVKLIDKYFWDKEAEIFNPYLKVGYETWKKQLREASYEKNIHRESTAKFRSRWEPKFVIIDNSIYLIPPIHKVKEDYDYRDITILVQNNDIEIYRNNSCDVREIIGGYQVNVPQILVKNPLGKLTYKLIVRNKVIYDSKDKLYRNYIIFNNEGYEITNNKDFEGTVYICYKNGDVELPNISTKEYYNIGYKLINLGDTIRIGNDVFNFSSMIEPTILGKLHKNCFVCKLEDNNYFPVYKEVNILVFEADNKSNKLEVIINGKPNKLIEMKYHKTTLREGITKYMIKFELAEIGVYIIEVNQIIAGKKNKILKKEFVYDNSLEYSTEKLNEDLYRIKIKSDLLLNAIDTEISSNNFKMEFINFNYRSEKYNYFLPLNTGFYKIDNGNWNPSYQELWINDITFDSKMIFFDSECEELLVYKEDGILVEDHIFIKNRGFYKEIPIGFLNSYKNSNKYVLLVFMVEGKKKYTMFCNNKCIIDEKKTKILFSDNPKQVIVMPVFYGKNNVFFEIIDECSKQIYKSKELRSGQVEILEDFKSFEKYIFNFYEKIKVPILYRDSMIYSVSKIFYAKQDYIGRIFKIDIVYYEQFIRGECITKLCYFNNIYLRILDIIDISNFKGEIFIRRNNREQKLDRINPVEVEICSEVVDNTIKVYITNCGDGLLLNLKKNKIINSLIHPTAPDISLYKLSLEKEI